MGRVGFRFVCFLVIIATFIVPICTMKWTSFWLEFHDWWLLFTWGHYVIFGEIGILGSINELGFDSVYVIFLSIFWIILSIVLLISYFIDTKNHQFPTRGFIIALIILMLQIVLPAVMLQLAFSSGAFISNITPFPAPSIIMIVVYAILFAISDKKSSGSEFD